MESSKMNQNFEDVSSILQENDMVIGPFNIDLTFKILSEVQTFIFRLELFVSWDLLMLLLIYFKFDAEDSYF